MCCTLLVNFNFYINSGDINTNTLFKKTKWFISDFSLDNSIHAEADNEDNTTSYSSIQEYLAQYIENSNDTLDYSWIDQEKLITYLNTTIGEDNVSN